MSEPTGARRYGVGGGDAYYDAVRYGGYEGTREQFGRDQAEFAQNAAAVAEAKETVERDAEEVRNTKNTFENTTVPEAIRALEQESEDQILAITQKGEEVSQQVETVGTEQKDAVANEGRARVRAVEQAGTDQVQAVNDAGTTQVGNVNQAGEDQVDAVEQAGADQVQAVTDEGTTQVQRVQDKGDEVLASIPADYTTLNQKVAANNLFQNSEVVIVEDYGYGIAANLEPENVATPTGVGIKRDGQIIELNTLRANNGARIKLNGEVVRTGYSGAAANAIVDAWEGITLKQYHAYKVSCIYISGEASSTPKVAISVYEQGNHSTIGFVSTTTDEIYSKTFTYVNTPVNIVLVVPNQSSTYSDFRFYIILEDITEKFVEDTDALAESVRTVENYVDYKSYDAIQSFATSESSATSVGIAQHKDIIKLDGTCNTVTPVLKIKISDGTQRNQTGANLWEGIDFIVGHKYKVVSTLISGEYIFPQEGVYNGVPISIYAQGTEATYGYDYWDEAGRYVRIFSPYQEKNCLAVVIPNGTVFSDAIFSVVLTDITDQDEKNPFLAETKTKRLFTIPDSEYYVAQSCVVKDGILYIYSSLPTESIRKIDLINGTDNIYDLSLGHGNGMCYYNGYLYVCSMESSGNIYKVDISNMTIAETIVFKIDGTVTVTAGIAYDYERNQFILKISGGFAFCDTDFVYDHSVRRSWSLSGATGQGISCDKDFIYAVESSPNCIHAYKYDGKYAGLINVNNSDEPENIYNDGEGGWFMVTNVANGGGYVDAVQFYKELTLENIASISKLFGKIPY